MKDDDFLWLQQWYQSHCNEDWEYDNRIHLGTIDNPGWSLEINLKDTELEKKHFQEINDMHRSEKDWMFCTVRDTKFDSACGVENLPGVLKVFRYWVENELFDPTLAIQITENSIEDDNDDFLWLQEWYQSYCNGDWEHDYRIHFRTINNPGWSLTINVDDTDLDYADFQQIKINRSEQDWIFCEIKDLQFEARCGVENLPEVLKVFRHWAVENEPSESNEYTWDDSVIIRKDAPKQFFPGEIGTIFRMWEIKREDIAKEYRSELGDWLYVVELKNGRKVHVAGRFLEKYPEE